MATPRAAPHRFHFSQKAQAGTCSCGRWAITRRRAMTNKAGPGPAFVELTEQQALKDWGNHIANLPEGQTVHSSASVRTHRAAIKHGGIAA
ncbi:protein of unknown function [Nitrospira japonica]|uniref:Uncharacterized protein n=1 Tax=Nitrospira japonica TaxID=1325564 RepID=A0A1W1I8B9_9BACT|nr:hypothetical protein [Nitrospira japonica]SLM49235.1 protein of unknown function [Nitrospira japonica]